MTGLQAWWGALLIAFAASPSLAAPVVADPVYAARCQMCHQRDAQGLPGQFPRLGGRVDKISATPAGRRYLIMVVLNGMGGPIIIDGQRIVGYMPALAVLKDEQVAGALNAVMATAGRTPATFTAAEVAKVRAEGRIASTQVADERARLVAAKAIP